MGNENSPSLLVKIFLGKLFRYAYYVGVFLIILSVNFSYIACLLYGSFEGFPRLKKLETLDLALNNLINSSILSSLNGLTALTTLMLGYNFMHNFSAQGTLVVNYFIYHFAITII
jgi:hypothetical protein